MRTLAENAQRLSLANPARCYINGEEIFRNLSKFILDREKTKSHNEHDMIMTGYSVNSRHM